MIKNMEPVLFARDFLDESQDSLRSAEKLADAVVEALRDHSQVSMSMDRMPSISSGFFNVILRRVVEAYGQDGLNRLNMTSPSPILKTIFQRSVDAARRLAS